MDTSTKQATERANVQRLNDLLEVMRSDQQRGGFISPARLSDELPDRETIELPHQWVEPKGK